MEVNEYGVVDYTPQMNYLNYPIEWPNPSIKLEVEILEMVIENASIEKNANVFNNHSK